MRGYCKSSWSIFHAWTFFNYDIGSSSRCPQHKLCVFAKLIQMNTKVAITTTRTLRGDPASKPNARITALCKEGRLREALGILYSMDDGNIQVDSDAYASLIQVCTDTNALSDGKSVHNHMLSSVFQQNIFLGTKLVSMYVTCNSLANARAVFDNMLTRNVFCWNAMIRGYIRNELWEDTLALYYQMIKEGIQPDGFTFPYVLKACGSLSALQQGQNIHGFIVRTGLESDSFVASALIDMYAKCGCVGSARNVFDKMSQRDIVSWSVMIGGCAQNGHCEEALELFCEMQLWGLEPDPVTITNVLPACARLTALRQGKEVHDYIIRRGFEPDVFVQNALVDMYTKCECPEDARQVFDRMSERDVVSWSSLIAGYSQNGLCGEALKLFQQMALAGLKPNSASFASVLPACALLAVIKQGREIHNLIIRSRFELDVFVGSALIDMYAKCGSINTARQMFDRMSCRDVVLWNVMIASYLHNGHCSEALKLFNEIQCTGMKPDTVTMVNILPACARLAALQHGKEIHNYIIRSGFESNISVGNALIDMYSKCGSVGIGRRVFDKMYQRDVVSWNAMIAGYGMHGHGEDALVLFYQMQKRSIYPDHITFIALLSACSHAGFVDKGWQYFDCMSQDYQIMPRMEHYACMVDLLGRAGHLDKAWEFIKNMPLKPGVDVWGGLLGACRVHCNIELAELVAEHLFELNPDHAGYYVLLSNIYAAAGRWTDVTQVRAMIKDRGLTKNPGCSWTEVGNKVHAFLVGDRSHPQSKKIYSMLESLAWQMKEAGYVPDTTFVLHDAEEHNSP